tara:strand:+ start:4742 stop:6334 length:1593 start_codon:yes stop_codon:yes gene_type:complete
MVLSRKQRRFMQTWVDKNPGWTIMRHTDTACLKEISNEAPSLLQHFEDFQNNAQKADICRYVVLYKYGGIYADIDVECLKPLDSWLSDRVRLVIGLENDFQTVQVATVRSYARQRQYQQWFMAASSEHSMLRELIQRVQIKLGEESGIILYNTDRSTLERTGPGIWTDVVTAFLLRSVNKLQKRADNCKKVFSEETWILPQISTAMFPDELAGLSIDRKYAMFVLHHFQGSWKHAKRTGPNSDYNQKHLAHVTNSTEYGYPLTILPPRCALKAIGSILIFVRTHEQLSDHELSKWGTCSSGIMTIMELHTRLFCGSNYSKHCNFLHFVEFGATTGLYSILWMKLGVRVMCFSRNNQEKQRISAAGYLSSPTHSSNLTVHDTSAVGTVHETVALATQNIMTYPSIVLHFNKGHDLMLLPQIDSLLLEQHRITLFDRILLITATIPCARTKELLLPVLRQFSTSPHVFLMLLSGSICRSTRRELQQDCWCPVLAGSEENFLNAIKLLQGSQNCLLAITRAVDIFSMNSCQTA